LCPVAAPHGASGTALGDSRGCGASDGGADRRPAKNASEPDGSIVRSDHPARPLHSPEGGQTSTNPPPESRGVATAPRRDERRVHLALARLTGTGPAGLRSLPAKQHAPTASPPRYRTWPADGLGAAGFVDAARSTVLWHGGSGRNPGPTGVHYWRRYLRAGELLVGAARATFQAKLTGRGLSPRPSSG
jgi:hypothetical protein